MFFYIGSKCDQLTEVNEGLFLDDGWEHTQKTDCKIWFKGYSTECRIENSTYSIINGYKPKGIWCVISLVNGEYKVYHADFCTFPFNGHTNLYSDNKFLNATANLIEDINSMEVVVNHIISILIETCVGYHTYNTDTLNIWCTGGLDSVLLLAVCERANIPYNLYVDKSHSSISAEYNSTLTKHIIAEFANYAFMSRFTDKTVLGTGYGGDSTFCRHPEQIKILTNSLGLSVRDVVKPNHYIYPFLKRLSFDDTVNKMLTYETEEEIKKRILYGITQWFTVWHLDNTITFNPLMDIDLAKIVLTLPIQELIDASLDGLIQKEAIKKCKPELMCLLDTQKNTALSGKNLSNNLDRVNLSCSKKIFIV